MQKYFIVVLALVIVACASGSSGPATSSELTPSPETRATSIPVDSLVAQPQLKFIEFFGIY